MASLLTDRRYLITGASGLIGYRLAAALTERGAEVISVASEFGDRPIAGRRLELDLTDRTSVASAVRDCDVIVHLAARSGGIQVQQGAQAEILFDNQAMTRHVLEAAAASGVRRVFLSSSAVVYRSAGLLDEAAPLIGAVDRPNGYAWSKVCDEVVGGWYSASSSLEVVIGRFTNVYGPLGPGIPLRSTVIYELIERATKAAPDGRMEVWGDGSAVRSFVYVDDAVDAIMAVVARGISGEAYNIDSSEPISVRALAEQIRDLVAPKVELDFDPSKPSGSPYRVLDTTKVRQLGFTPGVTLADGLVHTVGDGGNPIRSVG